MELQVFSFAIESLTEADGIEDRETWSRKDSYCADQYVTDQPEEVPSVPVKIRIRQIEEKSADRSFDKFDFAKEAHWYE